MLFETPEAQLARKIAKVLGDYERRAARARAEGLDARAERYERAAADVRVVMALPFNMRAKRFRALLAEHANGGMVGHD